MEQASFRSKGLVGAEWGLRSRPAPKHGVGFRQSVTGSGDRASPVGAPDGCIMARREGDVKGKSVDSRLWTVGSRQ